MNFPPEMQERSFWTEENVRKLSTSVLILTMNLADSDDGPLSYGYVHAVHRLQSEKDFKLITEEVFGTKAAELMMEHSNFVVSAITLIGAELDRRVPTPA